MLLPPSILRSFFPLLAPLTIFYLLASASAQVISLDCKPDFLEPNNDFQNSTYVALPVMAPELTLCPAGDRDFFRFRLQNETELTFAINCDTPELKLEGFLWDYNRGRLVLDGAQKQCSYTARLKPQPIDTMWWFFEIQSADTSAIGSYSLYIKEGPLCLGNDTNTSPATAALITSLPFDSTRSLCPQGAEEWFRIPVNATMNLTLATDCGPAQFPPKQMIGVWSDGVTELVIFNSSAQLCYHQFTDLAPRNASNAYTLQIYTLRQAFGPFRLVIEETVTWTFPPIPYQLPSHRVFATFVLVSVLSVILCCLLGLFWMQMRGSQEEGLLDEHNEGGEELTENVGGAATPPASPASGAKGDGL